MKKEFLDRLPKGIYTAPTEDSFVSDQKIKKDLALKGQIAPVYQTPLVQPQTLNQYVERAEARKKAMKEASQIADNSIEVTLPETSTINFMGDLHFGNPNTDNKRIQQEVEVIKNTPNSFVMFMGDLVDGIFWGGASQSEQNQSLSEQHGFLRSMFKELRGKVIVGVSGEHDCIDDQTEALTKRGWLKYYEIKNTDEFLTINPITGFLEWHKYTYFHKYNVNKLSMVRIKTRDFDFFGTENHRFFIQGRRNGIFDFKSALEFSNEIWGNEFIPMASTFGLPDYKINDNVIGLLAWIIADGWVEWKTKRIRIGQRQEKSQHLRKLLIDGRIPFKERKVKTRPIGDIIDGKVVKSRKPFMEFEISPGVKKDWLLKTFKGDKHQIPELVWKLSDRQFDIFLKHFILADGTHNSRKNAWLIFQKNEKFINDLQALCATHGLRSNVYTYKNVYGTQRRLNVCRRNGMRFNSPKLISNHQNYSGIIWDITVPNGNFMIRRCGKSYFTGNSKWQSKSGSDPYDIMTGETGAPYVRGIAKVGVNIGNFLYKIVGAHKMRGHSMYNKNHPTFRMEKFNIPGADVYVSAHNHQKQIAQDASQNFDGGHVVTHVAIGPYKSKDEYGDRSGFPEQQKEEMYGAAVRLHKEEKKVDVDRDILNAVKRWSNE